MSEEHGNLIKTPKQLIVVCALALIIPVAIAILGAQLVTGNKRIDTTEAKKSVDGCVRKKHPLKKKKKKKKKIIPVDSRLHRLAMKKKLRQRK